VIDPFLCLVADNLQTSASWEWCQAVYDGACMYPDYRGSRALWHTGTFLQDYMALHPTSQQSSYSPLWQPLHYLIK